MVETYVKEVVKIGSPTYYDEHLHFRKEGKAGPVETYVEVKWNTEVYAILEDGAVYVQSSNYLQPRRIEPITNPDIVSFFMDTFAQGKEAFEDEKNVEVLKELKAKNQQMKVELEKRKQLRSILDNLRRDLIEQ